MGPLQMNILNTIIYRDITCEKRYCEIKSNWRVGWEVKDMSNAVANNYILHSLGRLR